MIKKVGEDHYIDAFIQSVVDCGMYDVLIGKNHKVLIDLYFLFNQLKQFPKEKLAIVPISNTVS